MFNVKRDSGRVLNDQTNINNLQQQELLLINGTYLQRPSFIIFIKKNFHLKHFHQQTPSKIRSEQYLYFHR